MVQVAQLIINSFSLGKYLGIVRVLERDSTAIPLGRLVVVSLAQALILLDIK